MQVSVTMAQLDSVVCVPCTLPTIARQCTRLSRLQLFQCALCLLRSML